MLARFAFADQPRLALDLLRLARELDEDLHLAAQDLRHDRLEHEVDGAERVAAQHGAIVLVERGQEDDWRVPRFFARAHQLGGLEAVEIGHLHVEQDDGEVALEQLEERLAPGGGGDERPADLAEHGLHGQRVRGSSSTSRISTWRGSGIWASGTDTWRVLT